ncbi:MAG: hypothetical protein JXA20_17025 [Spirochaetes bacterium]|nr:hypothetical protein [Spirochaetota bacterium]
MNLMFIVYSNAVDDEMAEIARRYAAGYTKFTGVHGEGCGEPHLGSHIWPGVNNCMMVAAEKEQEAEIAREVRELKEKFSDIGIRVFTVPLKKMT